MVEAIEKAKRELLAGIEARVIQAMEQAVSRAKADIAASVLDAVSDPFDAAEVESTILDELGAFDWSAMLSPQQQ